MGPLQNIENSIGGAVQRGTNAFGGAIMGAMRPIAALGGKILGAPPLQQPLQKPFVINGLKAAQPGGLANNQSNTLKSGQTAKPGDQKAVGSSLPQIKTPSPVATVTQPLTGNVTTPSGAVVNATTGQTISTPGGSGSSSSTNTGSTSSTVPTQTTPQYPGVFGSLLGQTQQASQGNIPIGQNAADIAAQYGQEIARIGGEGARAQAGYLTTGTTPVAQGNAAVIAQTTAAQQQALAQGEQAALTGTGQQLTAQGQAQSGLSTAAGLAKPSPTAFGQTVFNPTTGQFENAGAGGTGSNLDPQTLATQLAPLVASGQLTFDAANAQMTGGVAGTTALRNEILKSNPNFNFNLSASSAQTQAQGQQLQTQSATVNQALDTLTNFYSQLSPFMTGGIPLTNDIAQSIGHFLGSDKVSQFNNALSDARVQVQNILGSIGVTPTESGVIANTYLPAGMTPSQLQANIGSLKTLIQQKVDNFVKSGQQSSSTSGTSTSSQNVISTPYGNIDPSL